MDGLDVNRAIKLINRQMEAIELEQTALLKPRAKRTAMSTSKLTSQVMTLARGLSALLAELRKTGEDIEEQLAALTPERTAQLALLLVGKLAPEYRAAVGLHIQELDGKLIDHG